jgi:arginyl-tRNA synthetase
MEAIGAKIDEQGLKIRELKANIKTEKDADALKALKGAVDTEVKALQTFKAEYKAVAGTDYVPANAPPPPPLLKKKDMAEQPAPKQDDKKASKDSAKDGSEAQATIPAPEVPAQVDGILLYTSPTNIDESLKCCLAIQWSGLKVSIAEVTADISSSVPYLPCIVDTNGAKQTTIFGGNSICRYLARDNAESQWKTVAVNDVLDIEEFLLAPLVAQLSGDKSRLQASATAVLDRLEPLLVTPSALSRIALFPALVKLFDAKLAVAGQYPNLDLAVKDVKKAPYFLDAQKQLKVGASSGKKDAKKEAKEAKKDKKDKGAGNAPSAAAFVDTPVTKAELPTDLVWDTMGLISSLHLIFSAALLAAFPEIQQLRSTPELDFASAHIVRCGNAAHGDFQCNNAMSLSKELKSVPGYTGCTAPRDVAARIIAALPDQPIVSATSAAPNGFINIQLSTETMVQSIMKVFTHMAVMPPSMSPLKVLVDFSSPNIAKEMHVGHLRSTIIGDAVSRVFEFVGYDVMRVNHVGDWGTQFGMLITYLQELYPDILTNPPNISDLTLIYKESKRRFDADLVFKETARLNVVKLQSGDSACRAIWTLLCNISRVEFDRVYTALGVKLTEVGESFYNPMIPATIEELTKLGLIKTEENLKMIFLPHFTIPLIVQKSDGGYGYDSTDMTALNYRIHTLERDWLVYITDAGQATHFHMCFDAGREAGWFKKEGAPSSSSGQKNKELRVDHIGFGVVCGEDGKRFKTRSSETVRLIDLLDAAKDVMRERLEERSKEGKTTLAGKELEDAASKIGYGAVKYFDLKNHPSTNYIFNYDRMLDTKGDTAVYLLFAYARIASILRKASAERGIDIHTAKVDICLDHPAERALAFEILQLGDVIKNVVRELLPNRLCDYLKEMAVKSTDFVTKCHVLNADTEALVLSRLALCEAARKVMAQCFELLGIDALDRI